MVEGKFKVVEDVQLPASPKWSQIVKANMGEYADKSQYSMVFKGYFNAHDDGMYEFVTKSDDGSLVYFGEKLVVDNGGNHSAIKRSGMIALKKGCHAISIIFHQGGGGGELTVWYARQGDMLKELDGNICGF
ncbi:PA14 domain-containing protein [Saccharicrinis sp. GN24d3]|uniref:PA14 domain-containing protein n=1 Tax=Saccharicrinis sp. GN24d3 TaxID=3458416 RepID=UPI004036A614